jgi:hypothetical protein
MLWMWRVGGTAAQLGSRAAAPHRLDKAVGALVSARLT